jgi:hypothetical protein
LRALRDVDKATARRHASSVLAWLLPPMTVRKALVVFAALWVGIYAVLAFANISPPGDARCKWAFPKILSCLLGVRENLAVG